MILANLTRAIREQNYYAVFLEFIIVILGVVIGFQVSAWNAERQDRAREAHILCRLSEDFMRIEPDILQHLSDAQATYQEALAIADNARRGLELDDLASFSRSAVTLRVPPAGSATYNQLVSSGDMGLIRSDALRAALTDFGENLDRNQGAGDNLAAMLITLSGPLFQSIPSTPEQFDTLPAPLREELEAYVRGREFYLASQALPVIAHASLKWKEENAERVLALTRLLSAQTTHCKPAAESAP